MQACTPFNLFFYCSIETRYSPQQITGEANSASFKHRVIPLLKIDTSSFCLCLVFYLSDRCISLSQLEFSWLVSPHLLGGHGPSWTVCGLCGQLHQAPCWQQSWDVPEDSRYEGEFVLFTSGKSSSYFKLEISSPVNQGSHIKVILKLLKSYIY